MAEFSQEELAVALRIIFEAESLNDQNVLIEIDEGILIEEAAASPENVPSEQNQLPDESSDDEEPKEVIDMGYASDSGEDIPEWDRSESEFEGFDDPGRLGVGRWVSRCWWNGGLGEGSDSEVSSVGTSDLSSDYDPADDSDEESDADVNVSSRFGVLSDTVALAAYQARADLPTFRKQHGPLLHVAGDSAYTLFCSL